MPAVNVSSTLTLALGLPMSAAMRFILVPALAACTLLGQSFTPVGNGADEAAASDLNINSRYTIESINFIDHREYKLSTSALDEIRRLVGAKVSTEALDRLARRIRGELRAHDVTFKLTRGAAAGIRASADPGGPGRRIVRRLDSHPQLQFRSRIHGNGPTCQHHRSQCFHLSNAARQRQFDRAFLRRAGQVRAAGHGERPHPLGLRIRWLCQDQYASSTLAALDERFPTFFPGRWRLWFPSELRAQRHLCSRRAFDATPSGSASNN